MTRISSNQLSGNIIFQIDKSREKVSKYSQEVSTGIKVSKPGDSDYSGAISQLQSSRQRNESYEQRIKSLESSFITQDNILSESTSLLIRAKEIATQGANESYSLENRESLSEEIFQIRDQLAQLANTKHNDSYVYSGYVDDTPPFSAATYANGTGQQAERFEYITADGATSTRNVKISDTLNIRQNTPGDEVFNGAIWSLERLGRALAGFRTDPDSVTAGAPTAIAPDGSGTAYDLTNPAEVTEQTQDILNSIDLLDFARERDISQERTNVAGRMTRLESAKDVLELNNNSLDELLSNLRDADIVDSATNLSLAQTALEAAYSVTTRVLNLSILSYL